MIVNIIQSASILTKSNLPVSEVTDPYQPIEAEQLQGSGARISIATKSDLVLRDLDIIAGVRTTC